MRHTASHLVPAGLAAAVLAGLGLLVTHGAGLTEFDRAVSDAVQAQRSAPADWAVVLVTLFGDATALTLVAAVTVTALLLRRAWMPAIACGAAFALTPLVVKAIKLLVARPRPTADLYAGVESFSFPSGHMTNSMVIYGALAIFAAHALTGLWRQVTIGGFILLVGMIGVSRVYLGAHWPSDVVAAVLLASISLFIVAWGFDQLPGEGRFARPYGLVLAGTGIVWAVYGVLTLEAALDHYAIDVTPEGTIELEEVP